MSKMIPRVISPKIKSSAERRIFEWFKTDPTTKNWVVFHSLGIENHKTLIYGELDFLVLAPELGVFSLEVKGGRVRREQGMWIFTNRFGKEFTKVRGPFEQASESMYSVFSTIAKKGEDGLSSINHSYGVMFPDITYENCDIDCSQDQVFDVRDEHHVGRFIKRLSDYNKDKARKKGVSIRPPRVRDIEILTSFLRGDFDRGVSLKQKLSYTEEHLFALTEEQYKVIDGLAKNKRVIVNGAAGTGKTVLAIKNAKESVVLGEDVGLFCYNLKLAKELNIHFEKDEVKPMYIGSFTQFLEDLVKTYSSFDFNTIEDYSVFYKETLPFQALLVLEEHPIKFTKIIIDEAQDLMTPDYLDVIDVLLEGGLKKGKWYFFGDFTYQKIFNRNLDYNELVEVLEEQTGFVQFELKVNCRNTLKIQKEMNSLFNSNIETLSNDVYTPNVEYINYIEDEDQLIKVEELLKRLIGEKIKKSDITILSPYKFEKSIASKIKRYKVSNNTDDEQNITYSTIQGFKGLENKIIIITDLRGYNATDLIYVAMSRARTMLVLFETEKATKYRKKLMKKVT